VLNFIPGKSPARYRSKVRIFAGRSVVNFAAYSEKKSPNLDSFAGYSTLLM
jgi:hypothetical protein